MGTPNEALQRIVGDSTQAAAAARILLDGRPISQPYLSELLSGKRRVTGRLALAIKAAFPRRMLAKGVTTDDLLRGGRVNGRRAKRTRSR